MLVLYLIVLTAVAASSTLRRASILVVEVLAMTMGGSRLRFVGLDLLVMLTSVLAKLIVPYNLIFYSNDCCF